MIMTTRRAPLAPHPGSGIRQDRCRSAWLGGLLMVALLVGAAGAAAQPAPDRVALLIGVGSFADTKIEPLDGPKHDVIALREVLVRRWGFAAGDVRTLVDAQATRANILTELAALERRSRSGGEVLIYFSGHGTSALNAGFSLPLPFGTGAFVPHDFRFNETDGLSRLIVGRTELRPVFDALEARGRKLWVISDSCYSGQQVRSSALPQAGELRSRMISLPRRSADVLVLRADLALTAAAPDAEPYPYRATAFLSAATEGERAKDIPKAALATWPTLDGKPHGAMTDALLRVLDGQLPADVDGDGWLSLTEVQRAVADFMATRAYGHTPQRLPSVADDHLGLGNRPVLAVRGMATKPRQAVPEPLRMATDAAPGSALPASLAASMASLPDVKLVGLRDPADVVLQAGAYGLRLVAASGDLLGDLPANDSARALGQVRQLAWAKRIRQLAERHQRAALPMDVDPAAFGGNFVLGSKISFVVRPDRDAHLVLLNINAEGKVAVLYPQQPGEDLALPAHQARHIPGAAEHQRIKVQAPLGMDLVFAFGFDEAPPGLNSLLNAPELDAGDARLATLERWLSALSGKFSFATANLRALPP